MLGVSVLASGMVTALGFNAPSSLTAIRAGISTVEELPWMDPASGEYYTGARVAMRHWWFGTGMLADLVAPAIKECLDAVNEKAARVPILLCTSTTDRVFRPADLQDNLMDDVCRRLGQPPHPQSKLIAQDQAGAGLAVEYACQLLSSEQVRYVIVAGVDSYLNPDLLDDLSNRRRLLTAENSNGFVPAEAGCSVLLGRTSGDHSSRLDILGIALSREPATIESSEAFAAEGLTKACTSVLKGAKVDMSDIDWRLTDLSGEHYKFKEAAFVAGRLDTGVRTSPMELWHPVEYLGQVGAAILPCLLALALHAGQNGYSPGPIALCHVGSDAGERAALVVRYHQSTREIHT